MIYNVRLVCEKCCGLIYANGNEACQCDKKIYEVKTHPEINALTLEECNTDSTIVCVNEDNNGTSK
jgi:hypothetical protein